MKKRPPDFLKEFRGEITPELIEELKRHRRVLGISLQQLGTVLRVNWSTIRKWEEGVIKHVRFQNIDRLGHYLEGDYDETLMAMNPLPGKAQVSENEGSYMIHESSPMFCCMERIQAFYNLCEKYPDLGEELVKNVTKILDETVGRLVHSSGGAQPSSPSQATTTPKEKR